MRLSLREVYGLAKLEIVSPHAWMEDEKPEDRCREKPRDRAVVLADQPVSRIRNTLAPSFNFLVAAFSTLSSLSTGKSVLGRLMGFLV